uniref:KNTC1 first ARM-repeats domain-containing protein n=1 Tax=Panagrolaimus davidi TaxID=227884 RepID=A0A914R0N9_9BILA
MYLNFSTLSASKRNITDHDTAAQLASRRYDLLTFSVISDCDNAFSSYAWRAMIHHDESVFHIFESSWAEAEVVAARVFLNRYSETIQDHMLMNGKVEYTLYNLQAFVLDNPKYLVDVIEFVQHDFGPFYLTINDDLIELQSRCNTLVDFVTNIAVGLGRVNPEKIPKNSLFDCEMLGRMLDILRLEKTSLSHQKFLYNTFGYLGTSTSNGQKAVVLLATRAENLRKMLRFKERYQCKIAYNQFVGHTVESICFLILDRCETIQTVHKHKVALPYMKEQGLNKDATLLEYIK